MEEVHIISSLETGGAENYLLEILKTQDAKYATVISLIDATSEINRDKVNRYNVKRRNLLSPGSIRLLKTSSVIYAWMYHAMLISILFNAKRTICMVRQNEFDSKDSIITKILAKVILTYLVRYSAGIVYVSEGSKLTHNKAGWKNKNEIVIENGYSISTRKIVSEVKNIGFVARNHPIKRFDLFIELSRGKLEKRGYNFHVFGSGYRHDKDLAENIIYHGEETKENIYKNLDVILILSDSEGNSNVLVEGLLAGCIVLSTDCGNASDILDKDLLINQDIGQIEAKLLEVTLNPEKYIELCFLATEHIKSGYSLLNKIDDLNRFANLCVE